MLRAGENDLLIVDDFYRYVDTGVHHQEDQLREQREQTRTVEMEEYTE
jgi:hypothetical protein